MPQLSVANLVVALGYPFFTITIVEHAQEEDVTAKESSGTSPG